jgi:hypothetical protein
MAEVRESEIPYEHPEVWDDTNSLNILLSKRDILLYTAGKSGFSALCKTIGNLRQWLNRPNEYSNI